MPILHNSIIAAADDAAAADPVTRSLRLAGSHYLTKTFSSSGNRKTYTIAFWVKRSKISTSSTQVLFSAATAGHENNHNINQISFRNNDTLEFYQYPSGSQESRLATAAVFRDTGAWMHCCFSVDTTQATEADRVKIFVNGVLQSVATYTDYPSQNHDSLFNKSEQHKIGEEAIRNRYNSDVLISDFYFIDGTALSTPIGNLIQDTGYSSYKPKSFDMSSYSGNSFHLKFEDSSDIGSDSTSNSNDWSTTGISSHDVLLDTPTKNYSVLNILQKAGSNGSDPSEGNLSLVGGSNPSKAFSSTIAVNSGKYYAEFYLSSLGYPSVSVSDTSLWVNNYGSGRVEGNGTITYDIRAATGSGQYFINSTSGGSALSITPSAGDIIQVAFDADTRKVWFGRNGTWNGSGDPANGTNNVGVVGGTDALTVVLRSESGTTIAGFGADPTFAGNKTSGQDTSQSEFYYAPPSSDFKSLSSSNLTAPVTPSEHFDILTYTGNSDLYNSSGSTQNVTGVNFDVGMAWIKDRDNRASDSYTSSMMEEYGHYLFDTVTGTSAGGYNIDYDVASGMGGGAYLNSSYYGVTSFSAGSGTNRGITVDESGETNFKYDDGMGEMGESFTERYVAWLWKLGSTGSSSTWNSSYTAPTTEHYNASAGVTTIEVTPASSGNLEVAHSLSAAPEFFWVTADQEDSDFSGFPAFHKDLTSGSYLKLDGNSAQSSSSTYFPSGAAHADYIKLGSAFIDSMGSGFNLRIWAFTGVEGYSKFGKYTGNGSTDGAFIHLGFRPAFFMFKQTSSSGNHWNIVDNLREGYNAQNDMLFANVSNAESNATDMDILSNGFKLRTSGGGRNGNNETYIYAAFAESPFSKSNAR